MAKIYIEPVKAKATLDQQMELERALQTLSQDTESIRRGLNYKISGREAIDARLRDVIAQITKETHSTKAMRIGLDQIITHYEHTEKGNVDCVAAERTSIQQERGANAYAITSESQYVKPLSTIISGIYYAPIAQIAKLIESIAPGIAADIGHVEEKDKNKHGTYKGETKIHRNPIKDTASKFYWNPKTRELTLISPDDKNASEKFDKQRKGMPIDLKLASVGTSKSISALAFSEEFKNDYYGFETKTHVGEVKADIDGYIGWLGMGGAVGISTTAFTSEVEGYLGLEDLQLYGKANVSVGKLEAKASGDVSLLDEDGNFDPSLHAKLSAEALGGEISGTLGGKVAGADVSVTGKLNYGIGAHADIGYKDGKFSFDIGATLGVGGSIKFDIDVSGVVDAFAEDARTLLSGVKSGIGKLKWW